MTEAFFADELSPGERNCLLSAPGSELWFTKSGREVIRCHALNDQQLYWLAKELGFKPWSDRLYSVLGAISRDEPLYSFYFKKKGNGYRKILVPDEPLKDIQRRILDNILVLYPTSESAFGYSGGSVFDALVPHLESGNRSLFSTDIENAFGSVRFEAVFEALYGLPMNESYKGRKEQGYLSWEVTFALCRLVTCDRSLPQGAPSSPRLFDMVFRPIDQKLEHLAQNVGGTYTRYADNVYFSMPQSEFPKVVARAIIRTIHENKREKDSLSLMHERRFRCHETSTRPLGDEAIRALGVNLAGGKVHPSRQLKSRIRLSIHRLSWLLQNTPSDIDSIIDCWGILQGQMSFASQAELPESLLEQYRHARRSYEGLLHNGEVPTTRPPINGYLQEDR